MLEEFDDFSPANLVRANRANLYELFRFLKQSVFMDFSQGDGLARWSCAFQYDWFNSVLCARDATPADSTFVDESLSYYKSRKTESIGWWLEDGVNQASWEALLLPRGFKYVEGPAGMSVDLSKLTGHVGLPTGAQIKVVENDQGLKDCADALVYGYEFPLDWKDVTLEFLCGIGLDAPYRSYVAYCERQPVATAAVLFGKEVAGIYSVATRPEFRGKGFGRAVTMQPLLDARKMGYRAGILQASAMGIPVYQQMGFEQNYRVGSYSYTFK